MAIQRWDPLRDLMDLQERMKQLFDEVLARSSASGEIEPQDAAWRPPIDLVEEPGRYVLRADLPGVAASDLEIHVEEGTLHLRGDRKPDNGVGRDGILRIERPHGPFRAQVALPPSVEQQAIEASHRNGVIEIVLPKRKDKAPGKIRIAPG